MILLCLSCHILWHIHLTLSVQITNIQVLGAPQEYWYPNLLYILIKACQICNLNITDVAFHSY